MKKIQRCGVSGFPVVIIAYFHYHKPEAKKYSMLDNAIRTKISFAESCVRIKETRSVTMKIFRKFFFSFKSYVKVELSYVFTIHMFSTAENCMEK